MGNKHTDVSTSYTGNETAADDNHHTDVSTSCNGNGEETVDKAEHTDDYAPKPLDDGELPEEPRSDTIELETPVDDIEELWFYHYIETILRAANLDDPTPFDERTSAQREAIDRNFDAKVIEFAPTALSESGIALDAEEWPISEGKVLTLVLQHTRCFTYSDIADRLDDEDSTRRELGLDSSDSKSTIWNWKDELDDDQFTVIKHAAIRCAHAAYRRGVPFPEEVWNALADKEDPRWPVNPGVKDAIQEGNIEPEEYDAALDNWAERFLDECLLPAIDFDRTEPKYPLTALIGMCAHAAIIRTSLRDTSGTVRRDVGYDGVTNENTVLNPIRASSVSEIESMFEDARANFFEFASNYNVVEGSKLLGFDLTDVPRPEQNADDPWEKGNASYLKGNVESADADKKWEFGVLTFADPEVPFALGLFPFGSDLNKGHLLSRVLRPVLRDNPIEVENLVMDRGFYTCDIVTESRRYVNDNWVVHAVHKGHIQQIRTKASDDTLTFIDLEKQEKYEKVVEFEEYEVEVKDEAWKLVARQEKWKLVEERDKWETGEGQETLGAGEERETRGDKEQWGVLNRLEEKPNVVVVPLHDWESNTEYSNWVFITDKDKEEIDSADLKETYKNRNRIEFAIGRLKSHFNIPLREDASTPTKFFSMNMAVMFYNLSILINDCISPEYGYPLSESKYASPNQVLYAIRDVAFEKALEEMRNR